MNQPRLLSLLSPTLLGGRRLILNRRCLSGASSFIRLHDSLSNELKNVPTTTEHAINWYACGPTVYAHSHIGHARCYVHMDIIRRVLHKVTGKKMHYVMGITDVDDKIIAAAQELIKIESHQSVNSACKEISAKFEASFIEDMNALGVLSPDAYLRVSDHIEEIVEFVQRLVKKELAYCDDQGNVWFDVERFHNPTAGQVYGKFHPKQFELSSSDEENEKIGKKNSADFSLWKAAKPGEPQWNSPWGSGRPGWHIECSAMTTSHFGTDSKLHLHSGGIDLKFPHHNNEIAQCEAFFGCNEWVQVWVHTGHIHIAGLKMSKSLKNFITIKDALQSCTADQFRIFCLQHHYSSNINYSEESLKTAGTILDRFTDFIQNSNQLIFKASRGKKWTSRERELFDLIVDCEVAIRSRLQDNIDTKSCLSSMLRVVSGVNRYMDDFGSACSAEILESGVDLVSSWLSCFGVSAARQLESGAGVASSSTPWGTLVDFRSRVRSAAIDSMKKNGSQSVDSKELLRLCDVVRDECLTSHEIVIEDGKNGESRWRPKSVN